MAVFPAGCEGPHGVGSEHADVHAGFAATAPVAGPGPRSQIPVAVLHGGQPSHGRRHRHLFLLYVY